MGVFSHCEKLKSVYLQDGVSTIGNEAFLDCTSLETGRDDYSKMPDYIMVNDVCIWYNNCYAEMTEWGYKTRRYKEVYEYPASIKYLGDNVVGNTKVTELLIPDNYEIEFPPTVAEKFTLIVTKGTKA